MSDKMLSWGIIFSVVFSDVICQYLPFQQNPCPNVFQYFQNNGQVLGYLEFTNDQSGYYELSVNMSVVGSLAKNKNIRLELRTPANDLVNGKPVAYFIYFPIQGILPKPTRVVFNNKLYCDGPPEDVSPGGTITNMWATTFFKVTSPPTPTNPGLQFFWQFGAQSTTPRPLFTLPTLPSTQPPTINVYLEEAAMASVDSGLSQRGSTSSTLPPFTNAPVEHCGYSAVTAQNLIVNGNKVKEGDFPWLVAIMYRQNYDYKYRCAGSLISRRHVITAAHCLRYYQALLVPIEDLLVVLGKNNIRNWASGATLRDAENITVHSNYQHGSGDYDVAIIKLNKDIERTPSITPVCIWEEDEALEKVVGLQGTVVGWGRDEDENQFVPDARSITLPIVSQVECLRSDPGFASLTSSRTFCAGRRDGTGPCTGDSGGGFFMNRYGRWRLRGLVSLSLGDANTCDPTKYFVFVDAAKIRDWILSVMA